MKNKISVFCAVFLFTIIKFSVTQECGFGCANDTSTAEFGEIIYAGLTIRRHRRKAKELTICLFAFRFPFSPFPHNLTKSLLGLLPIQRALLSTCYEPITEEHIRGIMEIFRHGDRLPEKLYPTDPYRNYSWPFEMGQLGNIGKQRAYKLGKFFRPRYVHLVGKSFSPSKVITHASSQDRTMMSGQLFNAGFFPPTGKEVWNDKLHWQPIPIHTCPADIDNVLRLKKPCERLKQLTIKFYQKAETIRRFCSQYQDEIAYMEKHSGFSMTPCRDFTSIWNMLFFQDSLLTETEQNLTLPEWTRRIYPEPLNPFRGFLLYAEADDLRIRRLVGGPLLNIIASDMLNVAGWKNTLPKNMYTSEPSKTPRLHLFAAHDTNLIIILKALGVYTNKAPNYSAAVVFELRKKDDRYYVTVIYANSLERKPEVLRIPYCKGVCTLLQFLSLVTPLIPANFDAECANRASGPTRNSASIANMYN